MQINNNSFHGKLCMSEAMLGFIRSKSNKELKVDDIISFYLSIYFDRYTETDRHAPLLKHIIYDLYEIRFRPIQRYYNDQHKNCYHYLIEIFPDLLLFHFNWTKQYERYLQVGQWYEGVGNLSNCGDPSEENSFVKATDINKIKHTCRLEQILANQIFQKCFEEWNRQTSEGPDYPGFLNRLGYPDKINEFRQNTDKQQRATKEIESTAIKENCRDLVLCFNL
ncbi:MAG: hypothetical protein U9Q84_08805 [Thermodesulfobacteriota bacterium]|nr:hypothetical protein [Thermodesulfobacteriota bacterium]